jgi:CheY-like chemotaxis protein
LTHVIVNIVEHSMFIHGKLIIYTRCFSLTYQAEDGSVAIEKAQDSYKSRNCYPDVIFMDHQMPVMTGLLAVRRLRADGCDSVILMVTGHALPDDVESFMNAGADKVILKPLHPKDVIGILEGMIR